MNNQGQSAVAIGYQAGYQYQQSYNIAIGYQAGYNSQQQHGIALGYQAGYTNQGVNAIAIGQNAGITNQAANSIVINATGNAVASVAVSSTVIKPLRVDTDGTNRLMLYNFSSGELTHSSANSSSSKTFVIDHPIDESKYLVHACLEGPEAGVYYRGEGNIPDCENNVEISLPEYIKDFTDFTVNITPKFNGKLRLLNVGDVKNGMFKVYGDSGPFYWVVFGKRNNLDVEPKKDSVVLKGYGPYTYIV